MNPIVQDLFPETLLVHRNGKRIYTTSLKVAEYFRKRHTNVLRAIENLLSECPDEGFGRLNFEPSHYLNQQKKLQPMYLLSHDGFAILTMGFTGKEALQWKIHFLNAFRAQEHALAQLTARYAHALEQIRPCLRPVVEGTEQGFSRAQIAVPLGKTVAAVTYHRRRARDLGLL